MLLVLVVVVPKLRLVVGPMVELQVLIVGQTMQAGCRGAVVPIELVLGCSLV